MNTVPLDHDWRLRLAAFARLRALADRNGGVVTVGDLDAGFEFEGETIRFWNARKGIWRPRQLGRDGAALTIVTTPPAPGKTPPYDDQVASDAEWLVYRYEGDDPELWTNRAVRRAYVEGRPLIYLYGIKPGLYEPIFPCTVIADRPEDLAFHVMAESAARVLTPELTAMAGATPQRAYATAAVKVRLHQRRFRELVLSAYRTQCAMCLLRHGELLDAAHILPDRDERGRPEVPNGLCLCKIHHGAYDVNIVGVDPDYRVHVRRDVLEEHDGPMLRYGLQEMEGLTLRLPRSATQRPRPEYLEERFARFRAA
jgi:putative restriction endonuclease